MYMKHNEHDKGKLIKRLKIIEGQIRGLQEMIEQDKYCIEIITQTSAVKQALSGIEDALMERHLSTCVVDQMKQGGSEKTKEEILKVYRLKRK
jgi:DNA-binding FrmR family transcriptional regulator